MAWSTTGFPVPLWYIVTSIKQGNVFKIAALVQGFKMMEHVFYSEGKRLTQKLQRPKGSTKGSLYSKMP
jgi:hypothetical protein